MHGIIFVSWDRFLRATFGDVFLHQYRAEMKQKGHPISLMNQTYPDDHLIQALTFVCQKQNISMDALLRSFGQYYIVSELTGFVCAALLQKMKSAKELVLVMADAHLQLKQAACEMHTSHLISPPIFQYQHIYGHPEQLIVMYQDPRQLCPLLQGAIEGAGMRYHEKVNIIHSSNECMRHGAHACRLFIQFEPLKNTLAHEESISSERVRSQEDIRRLILQALPRDVQKALTVDQLSEAIRRHAPSGQKIPVLRMCQLDVALRQLMAIGLVASTNTFSHCQYWRVSSTAAQRKPQIGHL
jgi:heme-NO-binding protein